MYFVVHLQKNVTLTPNSKFRLDKVDLRKKKTLQRTEKSFLRSHLFTEAGCSAEVASTDILKPDKPPVARYIQPLNRNWPVRKLKTEVQRARSFLSNISIEKLLLVASFLHCKVILLEHQLKIKINFKHYQK